MVRRYAHFAVGHLAAYADRAGLVAVNDNRIRTPRVTVNDNLGTNWSHQVGVQIGADRKSARDICGGQGGIEPPTRGFSGVASVRWVVVGGSGRRFFAVFDRVQARFDVAQSEAEEFQGQARVEVGAGLA